VQVGESEMAQEDQYSGDHSAGLIQFLGSAQRYDIILQSNEEHDHNRGQ